MIIFVFGNPDLDMDSLPLKILPELREKFPGIEFRAQDPNEEWDVAGDMMVIDTVVGIKKITVFNDMAKFHGAPRVSMHDFDALANLRYLQKLGKIKKVTVIGVPPDIAPETALSEITDILSNNTAKASF